MIKAIFFDVDGTLVSFNTHKIPESTIEAVREVRKKGVKVFIATGRPLPFINNLEGLEYDGIMSVNGASFMTADGEMVYQRVVPTEDTIGMLNYAKQHNMAVAFAANDGAWMINPNAAFDEVFSLLNLEKPQSLSDDDIQNKNILQIIAFFTEKEEPEIMNNVLKGCDAHRWHPDFADCIQKGMNKASGIDLVIQHYGIDINEVMAFGDGGNDMEMLKHVGVGVAMGNASEEVKKCAKIVTESVDNMGIARILQNIEKF